MKRWELPRWGRPAWSSVCMMENPDGLADRPYRPNYRTSRRTVPCRFLGYCSAFAQPKS